MINKIFQDLESNKENLLITDWGISKTCLEDVFLKILKK